MVHSKARFGVRVSPESRESSQPKTECCKILHPEVRVLFPLIRKLAIKPEQ